MRLPSVICALLAAALTAGRAAADDPTPPPPPPANPAAGSMPLSKMLPAKPMPEMCVYTYPVSTTSKECQQMCNQGFGFYYSYVYVEAARDFETAARHDPNCALAWWGLSRALEKASRGNHLDALKKAQELLPRASHREQMLITARLQEKGIAPGVGPEARKSTAAKTIDELLNLHDDDEEAWYYRAQLSDGVAAIPYYKALLRLNPLHPGANHELVHWYENNKRPALGWQFAEKYIESSPGIPHAFHMQAHLGTRIGKWDKTSNYSARAIELHREYQKKSGITPKDDYQFGHHLEVLTRSLIHDGRFQEARAIKAEARANNIQHQEPWFRLHLAERDWAEAQKIAEQIRRRDKNTAAYMTALIALHQNQPAKAAPEVDVLRQGQGPKLPRGGRNEYRLWEVQGLHMCQTGAVDEGLKLLARAADKSKADYGHHAWGNGAYFMEVWGSAALACGRLDQAEEGFLEALAHDPGSVRAAMGMQIVCERQGRTEEAERFAAVARRCWCRAEVRHYDALFAAVARPGPTAATASATVPAPATPMR